MRFEIDFFRSDTEAFIQTAREYHSAMERQLNLLKNEEWARLDAMRRTLAEEDEGEYWGGRQEHEWAFNIMFPRYFRYSFVVLQYLILEARLKELCETLRSRRSIVAKLNGKGSLIDQVRRFLDNEAKMLAIDEIRWTRINELRIIRNCIVHNSGDLVGSKDELTLRSIGAAGRGITIGTRQFLDNGMIVVEPEYCINCAEDVRQFFDDTFEALGFAPAVVISDQDE
jgi:hypothetical protein